MELLPPDSKEKSPPNSKEKFHCCSITATIVIIFPTVILGIYITAMGTSGVLDVYTIGVLTLFVALPLATIGFTCLFKWRPLLLIFVLTLVVLLILGIVATILAFKSLSSISTNQSRNNMEEAIKNYRANSSSEGYNKDINFAVDFVQDKFECCGVDNVTDWIILNPTVFEVKGNQPPSCTCEPSPANVSCKPYGGSFFGQNYSFNAWNQGCAEEVAEGMTISAIVAGVLAVLLVANMIYSMAITFAFFCCACCKPSTTSATSDS